MTLASGIHTLDAETYHEDRVSDQPSLSASIAVELVTKSPAHAKAAHPRLNPYLVREEKAAFDLGTAVHALLLEKRAPLDVIKIIEGYDTWKSPKAREERDYWRGQGYVPLLSKLFDDVVAMVAAAERQIGEHTASPTLLTDGHPEATLVWDEDGVACRSRVDHLRDDCTRICDLKTSGRSADPLAFSRNLYQHGYDIRASFYKRGVRAITGIDPEFLWIVVETEAPYALSVVTPGPDVLALGDDKVEYALRTWRRCLASGEFPGYTPRVATAEMPPYEETKWMDRRDEAA